MARIDERLSLALAPAEEALRSVPSVNSGESMLARCERNRLRQGAAGGGDDMVSVTAERIRCGRR